MTAAFRVEHDRLLIKSGSVTSGALQSALEEEGRERRKENRCTSNVKSWSKNKNDAAQSDPAPINVSHDTRVSNWGITLKT